MKIKKQILASILEMCRNAHPNETGGLLLGEPVKDFLVIPGRFAANSIYIHMDQIPIYANLRGTFHSHPSGAPTPSRADLDLFGRIGKEHLIIAPPFIKSSINVFSSRGMKGKLEVV